MRIGAGALRGRSLRVASGVRPTGARAREALFDIWADRVPGCRFLDLFAGSGAVGIEALSRGAASCRAIEGAAAAFRTLEANYASLPDGLDLKLTRARLPEALARCRETALFDLIYADPPYDYPRWEALLAAIAPLLAAGGQAAVEHGRRNRPPADGGGLTRGRRRAYGETEISFYSPSAAEALSAERRR